MKTLLNAQQHTSSCLIGLKWLPLYGLLAMGMGGVIASSKDMVPYAASLEMSVTAVTHNEDGTMHQVLQGTGNATHMGAVKIWLSIHVGAGAYDPENHAWVSDIQGVGVQTAANGDTLCFLVDGREIVPFDEYWRPIYPLPVEATLEVTGGSGRFKNATGTISFAGFDQDSIWGTCTGEISTVGANKR